MVNNEKKPTEVQFVMICPNCKSPNIEIDKSNALQPTMGLPPMYICNKCKHSGYSFPEVPADGIDKFEKEIVKEGLIDKKKDSTPLVDVRYGAFEVNILWKITAPILLLIGIFSLFIQPIFGITMILGGLIIGYITYIKIYKKKEMKR